MSRLMGLTPTLALEGDDIGVESVHPISSDSISKIRLLILIIIIRCAIISDNTGTRRERDCVRMKTQVRNGFNPSSDRSGVLIIT